MDNELSQLDALIESDVLDALGKEPRDTSNEEVDSDEIIIEDHLEDTVDNDEILEEDILEDNNEIEDIPQENDFEEESPILNEANLDETKETPVVLDQDISSASLSKLLSELLNNKTIEITIKIKD
jgi:hypothetical protein